MANKPIPMSVTSGNAAEIVLPVARTRGTEMEATSGRAEGEEYTGPYEVTPGEEPQTLKTKGFVAKENITVNPIPSDYGRIAQVGAVLRVF